MPINYTVVKKIDTTQEPPKELYYATSKLAQRKGGGIDEYQIAKELAANSSLSTGDVLSVMEQLSERMAYYLSEGRTINLRNIGSFYPSLTSVGVETPEECTADKVRISKICFRADKALMKVMSKTRFSSLGLTLWKREKRKKSSEKEGEAEE